MLFYPERTFLIFREQGCFISKNEDLIHVSFYLIPWKYIIRNIPVMYHTYPHMFGASEWFTQYSWFRSYGMVRSYVRRSISLHC